MDTKIIPVQGKDGLLYCPVCGEPLQLRLNETVTHSGFRIVHRACACERRKREMEDKRRTENEHRFLVQRNREICFPVKKMSTWTFENDNGSVPEMQLARDYVEHWDKCREEGRGLLLFGNVGSGKTYMAAAIANALLEQESKVLMRNFAWISNISAFEAEEKLNELSSFDLLILDDLGAERKSEFALQNVFNVIDRWWSTGKPMIVTTNLTPKQMEKGQDQAMERIYDRIFGRCIPVSVAGPSQRQSPRQAKADA
ncbi:MAG: ATP-binding protein [Lachnospiraceae bacterium]|nr:ATP-binding protein [Lachnospiraceae bacterium]